MKNVRVYAAAALLATAPAWAKDLLTKEQYIDYTAQMKCAEQLYSYSDPDKYDKEQRKIDKAFGVDGKDVEDGRLDDLAEKYGGDSTVQDAIDSKAAALCPPAM